MKKKFMVLVLSTVLSFGLCACSKNNDNTATSTDAIADAETTEQIAENTTENVAAEGETTEEKTSTEAVTEAVVSETTTESAKPQTTEKPKTTESTKPQTTEKPKTTESSKPQTTEKPKTTESSKPQTTEKPQTTQAPATTQAQTAGCQHDWVAQTKVVHHEAEYEEEQIPIEERHRFCNTCGKDLTVSGESDIQHSEASGTFMFNAGTEENPDWWEFYNCAGSHTGPAIVGYETKKYKVKDAWDETVITGYKCSKCGAVR